MGYRVFISFKNLDRNENPTPDAMMAEELYHVLTGRGINTFYSNISLKDLAASDFLDAIYAALEQCSIFIAVGSEISHFESRWLKFEARTFQMEYLNGNKPETEYGMITYVTPNLRCSQSKFIQPLRDMQSFCKLEDVVEYVTNRLQNAAMLKKMYADKEDEDLRYYSVSLADEVFERRHGVSPVAWDASENTPKNSKLLDAPDHRIQAHTTISLANERFPADLIGSFVLGRYKLIAHIGRGGSSDVFLAQDQLNGSIHAVKMLRGDGTNSALRELFVTEARMLKTLKHPMIPMFVDEASTSERSMIVMEYIAGESLQKYVDRDSPLQEAYAIDWMKQLCDFLSYLHAQGLVYRDLKPGNIMLQRGGMLTVLDYASVREIGKRQTDTLSPGTVGYASPEQYGIMGEIDGRTDIYSLGATMYHLVTGAVLSGEMIEVRTLNPGISPEFAAIIEKCIQINPWERYENTEKLRLDLDNLAVSDTRMIREEDEHILAPPSPSVFFLPI